MSTSLTPEQMESIRQSLYAGQKIQAIKLYRDASGHDLKASKDFIELLEVELRKAAPEKFTAPTSSGCGATAAFLLLGLITVIAACWFS